MDYIERSAKNGMEIQCQSLVASSVSKRTSRTWYLSPSNAMELIDMAELITGISRDCFEEPQIMRYEKGEQFTWHYDSIPQDNRDSSGNRIATLIVYLNDVPMGGGATCFRDLNIQVSRNTIPVQFGLILMWSLCLWTLLVVLYLFSCHFIYLCRCNPLKERRWFSSPALKTEKWMTAQFTAGRSHRILSG